jgi:hypothetical protein
MNTIQSSGPRKLLKIGAKMVDRAHRKGCLDNSDPLPTETFGSDSSLDSGTVAICFSESKDDFSFDRGRGQYEVTAFLWIDKSRVIGITHSLVLAINHLQSFAPSW